MRSKNTPRFITASIENVNEVANRREIVNNFLSFKISAFFASRAQRAVEKYMELNILSSRIIGAAIEVHKTLGPGLLESTYEECLSYELGLQGIKYDRQVNFPVKYKGKELDCGYRIDILVEHLIILELKAVEAIVPIHKAQLLTYLKISDLKLGFLLNFNVPVMKKGIHRMVNKLESK
jgi:GxxExxY protein